MRYFLQGWNEPDGPRRSMLLDIATEELSHLEMVAQTLALLLKGSPSELVDQVEGSYLGELLDGKMPDDATLALGSGANVLGGGGPRLTDSQGAPFTAAYVDTIGEPAADLRSDIAAEARAKIVYERLIKLTDDKGATDTLTFLVTREIAHQKMFEAALASMRTTFRPAPCPGATSWATHTWQTPGISARRGRMAAEIRRVSTCRGQQLVGVHARRQAQPTRLAAESSIIHTQVLAARRRTVGVRGPSGTRPTGRPLWA